MGLFLQTRDDPGPLLSNGPGVRQVIRLPLGEAVERSETDEGNLSFSRAFPIILSSPHSSALWAATFPRGEGERPTFCQAHVSGRAAQEGLRVAQTHPCFSPFQQAVDLLLKRESASRTAPETFLWGSGGHFFSSGQEMSPRFTHVRRAINEHYTEALHPRMRPRAAQPPGLRYK